MARTGTLNGGAALENAHEWVSFDDPEEERTWVFDITFMLSNWTCIYRAGCQGVLTEAAPEMEEGCCSYGAHFTDADDIARVQAAAAEMGPDDWQFRRQGLQRGIVRTNRAGEQITRLVGDACIFLNRSGFGTAGAGCSLHQFAVAQGRRPLDLKPTVCWQLPLRRDDAEDGNGHVTTTVTQWDRRHWGAGGDEFHWWCTEAPEAFAGGGAVYLTMHDELIELVGAPIYARLASYLESRRRPTAPLPHPVAVPSPTRRR